MEHLDEIPPEEIHEKIKVFINGSWAGCFHISSELVFTLRKLRRQCEISSETSIVYDIINRVSVMFFHMKKEINFFYRRLKSLRMLVDLCALYMLLLTINYL
jgi:hypothetical protein